MSTTKGTRKGTKRAAKKAAAPKLSAPANVARLFELLATSGNSHLIESVHELANETGESNLIEGFRVSLPRALRAAERGAGGAAAAGYYAALQNIIRRTAEGATLEEIARDVYPGDAKLTEPDARPLAQLKARAAEMIKDVRGFDADTRLKMDVALRSLEQSESGMLGRYADDEGYERTLREQVGRAERGESLSDLSRVSPEAAAAARAFLTFQKMDGLPEFVFETTQEVLRQFQAFAGGLWRVPEYLPDAAAYEFGDWSLEILAGLFHNPPRRMSNLRPELDLAGMIAAVMAHPDTPVELYNAIQDEIGELLAPAPVKHSPDVLRVALKAARPTEGAK